MAKFCTNCGKELDENAAMCLNCGVLVGNTPNNTNNTKKEKKKGLPTWAIVLIVVGCIVLIPVIAFIILGVTAYNVIEEAGDNLEDYYEETITQKGTIGDTLKTDTFKITLTDALKYDYIGDNEYFKDIPAEGREFLVFFFDVENISNESKYITSYDFSGYVDGYISTVKYLFSDIDGVKVLSTDLAPNMKAKGYVAFEVDKSWQEFEIHYSEMFEDSELVFTVVNENRTSETNTNVTSA